MATRYSGVEIVSNNNSFYSPIRRGKKNIPHYSTPSLHHPTVLQRASLKTITHIWRYGDRFYKLASQYYRDEDYWWVIAWYNGVPTEASINNGDVIEIPINIQNALSILGV